MKNLFIIFILIFASNVRASETSSEAITLEVNNNECFVGSILVRGIGGKVKVATADKIEDEEKFSIKPTISRKFLQDISDKIINVSIQTDSNYPVNTFVNMCGTSHMFVCTTKKCFYSIKTTRT